MSSIRLEQVTPDNIDAVCAVEVAVDQRHLVAPVSRSLAEAYVHPDAAWPRAIVDGDKVVGFVMAFHDVQFDFDPKGRQRSGFWRLNIDKAQQGRGYGTFAVNAVLAEIRKRGHTSATVTFVPGPTGPEGFYRSLGFQLTEHLSGDETVAVLAF